MPVPPSFLTDVPLFAGYSSNLKLLSLDTWALKWVIAVCPICPRWGPSIYETQRRPGSQGPKKTHREPEVAQYSSQQAPKTLTASPRQTRPQQRTSETRTPRDQHKSAKQAPKNPKLIFTGMAILVAGCCQHRYDASAFLFDGCTALSSGCSTFTHLFLHTNTDTKACCLPHLFQMGIFRNGRAANGKAIDSSHLEFHQTPAMNRAI